MIKKTLVAFALSIASITVAHADIIVGVVTDYKIQSNGVVQVTINNTITGLYITYPGFASEIPAGFTVTPDRNYQSLISAVIAAHDSTRLVTLTYENCWFGCITELQAN